MAIREAEPEAPSLPEAHRTIDTNQGGNWLKRFFSFAGPGYLVAVGYMDPGNWGTDLAGGAKYGYALLWVILASNLMAMLLQTLCARLGLVTGKDLAQACRDYYKKPVSIVLWILCEIAIIACDLAEVIGSAVAIYLLSGGRIPLLWGVLLTGFDVLILLGATNFGFRKLEAIVIALVATIGACFAIEIFFAEPNWPSVASGPDSLAAPQRQVSHQRFVSDCAGHFGRDRDAAQSVSAYFSGANARQRSFIRRQAPVDQIQHG